MRRFCHIDVPILYSSCLQYEGGVHEGGRGPCVWDTGTHTPGLHVIYTFFNVFEALPMHVSSLLECVISLPKSSPRTFYLKQFFILKLFLPSELGSVVKIRDYC